MGKSHFTKIMEQTRRPCHKYAHNQGGDTLEHELTMMEVATDRD